MKRETIIQRTIIDSYDRLDFDTQVQQRQAMGWVSVEAVNVQSVDVESNSTVTYYSQEFRRTTLPVMVQTHNGLDSTYDLAGVKG
jgi:hypothetical protein